MRAVSTIALLALFAGALPAADKTGKADKADKLMPEDRVEIVRGIMAEYATAKVLVPRSKKNLEFNSDGTYDKKAWAEIARTSGPAARNGDLVQITKIEILPDRLVLQLNGGYKGGAHWYSGAQIGMGPTNDPSMSPVGGNNDSNAPGGTTLALLFHKPMEPIKAAAIKKMLAPVLDFEKHSATEIYAEALPPEMQKAIKDKRATTGMTREQVMMALGRPEHKSRETVDGMESEDWVFGVPPGKITFVTFIGDKVTKVKEEYAGLGTIEPNHP